MKSLFTFFALTALALSAQSHPHWDTTGPVLTSNPSVSFSGFYTVKNNGSTVLVWSTPAEYNNNNFEIQRSTDGSHWKVIAIMLGAGTPTTAREYCYADRQQASAAARYRIRQVDNSTFVYSAVK
jgi:hypothetical protein